MPTLAQIRAELDADPLALGYAALVSAQSWQALADLLNAPGAGDVNRAHVPRGELLESLAGSGGLGPLYAAAVDTQGAAYSVAKAATLILDDPDGSLDYTRAGTQTLVAALGPGALAVLTADQLAALQAVCVKSGSRAEVLWGEAVSVQQVRGAGRLS